LLDQYLLQAGFFVLTSFICFFLLAPSLFVGEQLWLFEFVIINPAKALVSQ